MHYNNNNDETVSIVLTRMANDLFESYDNKTMWDGMARIQDKRLILQIKNYISAVVYF